LAAVTREQQLVNDRKIAHEATALARADAENRVTEEVSKSDASNVKMVIFKQREIARQERKLERCRERREEDPHEDESSNLPRRLGRFASVVTALVRIGALRKMTGAWKGLRQSNGMTKNREFALAEVQTGEYKNH
jgi:hypothetical protein